MRILRLDLGEGTGTIDLHPFISVLHDLDPMQRDVLTSAMRSLITGSGEGVSGLVESVGHLVELGSVNGDSLGPLTTENIIVAVDTLSIGAGDASSMAAELEQLRRAAQIDAVYVEEIRGDVEPAVAARVQRLRDLLSGIPESSVDDGRQSRENLLNLLETIRGIDPFVREIPEQVRDLMDDWYAYEASRSEATPHLESLHRRVQVAEAGFGDAQTALLEAKANAVPLTLTFEQEQRLEQLADTNLDRRGRRHKGLDPEQEAEMASLLAVVGVPTYTAYAMYRMTPTPPLDKLALVDVAEERVAVAQAEVEESRAAFAVDEVASRLSFQFDDVKTKARDHLGPMLPSNLGAALSELVIESDNPEFLDAVRGLYDMCTAEGLDVPESMEPGQLPVWVGEWVSAEEAKANVVPVVDRVAITAELASAEESLDRHARAMGRIDRLETRAAESSDRVSELELKIERIETGDVGTADGVLMALGPLTERIQNENCGSVPIVLDGNFDDLDDDQIDVLMDRLEPIAQQHQLILVTDRRRAATWASNVGLRRALQTTASVRAGLSPNDGRGSTE